MSSERPRPAATPCLCNALRQADRAVSRLYDEELRGVGLRTTQYSLLRRLRHAGEVRQRDLGALTSLDETTLTRNLRPLIDAGWVAIRPGEDRREKLVSLTDAGAAKLREARPRWERAQERMRSRLPEGTWSALLNLLSELTRLADTA
jgi:DNA-binding MarR family transcriptional regulator